LVAVNSNGEVSEKVLGKSITVPHGGYVLTDLKEGAIAKLEKGNRVSLMWHTTPNNWNDVVQAVSGGPMLLKDGKLYLDVKQEQFKAGWTGSSIHARTAAGVTVNNRLLLVTVEGPHTLWDMAKLLQKLGAVDAMNLDGGGSTTMVVGGTTVTKNGSSFQRRVASSLALLKTSSAPESLPPSTANRFHPPDHNIPGEGEGSAQMQPAEGINPTQAPGLPPDSAAMPPVIESEQSSRIVPEQAVEKREVAKPKAKRGWLKLF
jgi:hypothetical protein